MKVVIAGGTGFLGRPLSAAFAADGHQVVVLSRRAADTNTPPGVAIAQWDSGSGAPETSRLLEGADLLVNLAGESIAGRRWTEAHKARIRSSRVTVTRRLVEALSRLSTSPAFVSASAVGYYGDRGDETLTEASPPGTGFLAEICVEWEREALAAAPRARVALVRTGIALERDGGALERMLLPFKLFAGGPLGSGAQYMPWIHRDDWVSLVRWLATRAGAQGPYNATAPNPVTNREFSNTLGAVLHRPSFMPAPAFALKIALGEMAEPLLLASQRAAPARALQEGFVFKYTTLREALEAIVRH